MPWWLGTALLTAILLGLGWSSEATADGGDIAPVTIAQASAADGGTEPPRLQPVGNGEPITTGEPTAMTADERDPGSPGWYRAVVGLAVVAVVVFALFQRRHGTDGSGDGSRPPGRRRGPDRQALGH